MEEKLISNTTQYVLVVGVREEYPSEVCIKNFGEGDDTVHKGNPSYILDSRPIVAWKVCGETVSPLVVGDNSVLRGCFKLAVFDHGSECWRSLSGEKQGVGKESLYSEVFSK